jgi:hypothetical protein
MIDRNAAKSAEAEARGGAGPLTKQFLQYSDALCDVVAAAKNPEADLTSAWSEIESYFDVANFVRYGAFREVTGWADYRALLAQWAASTDFWYNFRRLTEAGDRIVWEIEEHNTPVGGEENICHSLTVAEFNADGKISRLDVYLQSEAMLKAHANWGD